MDERRRSARQSAHFALVVDDGAVFHAGTARDISDGGLFLETAVALGVGTVVHISPLDGPGLEVRARVVYAREARGAPRGLGLELCDAEERNRHLVETILGRPAAPRPPPRRTTIPPGQSGTS